MMRDRIAFLGVAAAAALAAGCSGVGLDPWPEVPAEKTGPVEHGLDPFPVAVHPHESNDTGLDPFPEAVHPEGQGAVGLNPFPAAVHPGDSNSLGLNPFPGAVHPEGQGAVGLNPFPAAMHPGDSNSLGLNPFPGAVHPEGQAKVGLNPFPKAVHPGESNSLGLNPFPPVVGRKAVQVTRDPGTGILRSDEYPEPPPIDVKPIPKSRVPTEKPVTEDGKPK